MCTTIIIGRNRSATGSFLLAHSEELGRNAAHRVEAVPRLDSRREPRIALHSGGFLDRPPTCARHLVTKIFDKAHYPGEHTSGVNEYGVAVGNNMALMRGIPEERAYDLVPGGVIWTEFMQVVLEGARTAEEGVALATRLCEERGLSCDSGTMLAIVDPQDAWWVELARDGQWAAQRVGPDEVSIRANCYRIGAAPDGSPDRYRCAATLMDHAQAQGWHGAGPVDFAQAYGDPDNQGDAYNLDRHAALEARFAGMGQVDAKNLMAALRDVYEGTERYRTRPDGSPFRTGVRTIARMNTEASTVIELRPNLPAGLGHRMWCSLSTSLTGTYVPFHLGIEAVEPHYALATASYDPRSAYWLFTELAKLADYGYPRCIETIRATWSAFEAETFEALAKAEAEALTLPVDQALAAVSAFDRQRAEAAIATLGQLVPEVKTLVFYEAF